MAQGLYQSEPLFRETVDRCADLLRPHLGTDLRSLLYPAEGVTEETIRAVTDTRVAQPAIFTIEYALAQLWITWGIRPRSMLGHSIGEYVAACLAGVFSLEDALTLVAVRGQMMQQIPAGGMLSVRMPELKLRSRLSGMLSIAAVNSPSLCVVAGPIDELKNFEQDLNREGVVTRGLFTSHAFHSEMMDPVVEPFTKVVANVSRNAPQIPFLSSVTGTWITDREATDPNYWARQIRETVRFSSAVAELRNDPDTCLLEVGPGSTLSTLARQHAGDCSDQVILSSLSDGLSDHDDQRCLMNAMGSLWLAGVKPDWNAFHGSENRRRISLPTYPFERNRFWLGLPQEEGETVTPVQAAAKSNQSSRVQEKPEPEEQSVSPKNSVPMIAPAAIDGSPRVNHIRNTLIEIFEELCGTDLASADGSVTFLELGFDSLFLTQVAQSIQGKFGLKIAFRQLLGDQSSMDALTQYLNDKLPPGMFSEPAPTAVPEPPPRSAVQDVSPLDLVGSVPAAAMAMSTSTSGVALLMREQLQAMNQLLAMQLQVLRGTTGAGEGIPASAANSDAIAPNPPVSAAPAPNANLSTETTPATGTKDVVKSHGPFRPIQKADFGELNERQQQHLTALIQRHTKRTGKSKQLTQQYRQSLADPRVVSGFRPQWKELVYPIITHRSKGSRLWDVDENEYIDLVNGFGSIMLGHRPEFIEHAIENQLRLGFEIGPQTPLAGEVARLFCEITDNERMTFCNTGSEAVMAALRVARTVTGRNKVVIFAGAYHGTFDEVLVKGFRNKAGLPQSAPVAPGIPLGNVSNMIVLDYGTSESLEWIRRNAADLAAVLVEPVQSRHPALQPVDFLKDLRRITQESETALIFDEIVTGFRVHPGGCQALFGIRADLATYGKVAAGGMPIGILAGKASFMDALDGGAWQYGDESKPEVGVTFFAGTFVRHPLTVAATKAMLDYLKEQGPALQEQLTARTLSLVRTLKEFTEQQGIPALVESFGSIFYFGFPGNERFSTLFYYHMRDKGIHVREGFPCFLTTAHTDADIHSIVQAFKESAIEMQRAGFFPDPAGAKQDIAAPTLAGAITQPSLARNAPITEPQLEIWLSDQLSEEASCSYNEFLLSTHARTRKRCGNQTSACDNREPS